MEGGDLKIVWALEYLGGAALNTLKAFDIFHVLCSEHDNTIAV